MWLERAYRLGVGSAVLAAASGGRVLGATTRQQAALPSDGVINFGVGLSDSLFGMVQRAVDTASGVLAPLVERVRQPVVQFRDALARTISPAVEPMQQRGRLRRAEAELELAGFIEALIPEISDLMVQRIDVAAVLARIDLQEFVEAAVEHIDMAAVMDRIDLDEAVALMSQRVDLTAIALEHIDMRRVIDAAMAEVDMAAVLRKQLEGMDFADLIISTPTSLATGALRQTSRFVRRS